MSRLIISTDEASASASLDGVTHDLCDVCASFDLADTRKPFHYPQPARDCLPTGWGGNHADCCPLKNGEAKAS